jgi:hypothetical protein
VRRRAGLDAVSKKIPCACLKSNLGHPSRSLVTILTELRRLPYKERGQGQLSVFTAVKIHLKVFWVVTPCSDVVGYRRFGGPCCSETLVSYHSTPRRHNPETSTRLTADWAAGVRFTAEATNMFYAIKPTQPAAWSFTSTPPLRLRGGCDVRTISSLSTQSSVVALTHSASCHCVIMPCGKVPLHGTVGSWTRPY